MTMKTIKNLFLIVVVILLSNNCFAKNNKVKKENEVKLSYEEYINQYGVDDTSIAIINIFFDKRENSGVGQMSILPISTAIAVAVPPIGVTLMALSTPLFINGMLVHKKYSHKNLIKTLEDYQNKNILSDKNKERVIDFLEVQQEIYDEELVEKNSDNLRSIRTSLDNSNNNGKIKKLTKLI